MEMKQILKKLCDDWERIKWVILGPFAGRYKIAQTDNRDSFAMLITVVFFALFGFGEFFSVYLPQFYDKIELPVWTFLELMLMLVALAVIWVLLKFGRKIKDKIESISWIKEYLPWVKMFFFVVFIFLLAVIAKSYPGTMKGYEALLVQLSSLAIGFSLFVYISDLNLRELQKLSEYSVGMLVLFVLGIQILPVCWPAGPGGVHRTFFGIQVCDLLAPMIVFSIAWLGCTKSIDYPYKQRIIFVVIAVFAVLLKYFQSNLSTALVYAIIAVATAWNDEIIAWFKTHKCELIRTFFSKGKKYLFCSILGGAFLLLFLLFLVQITGSKPLDNTSGGYQWKRFANWVDYDADVLLKPKMDKDGVHIAEDFLQYKDGDGSQGFYSKLAIMHGGILPKWSGSVINNKRKLDVSWADFIFAIMCSEFGFVLMSLLIASVLCFMLYFSKRFVSTSFLKHREAQGNNDDYLDRLAAGVFIYLSIFIIAHVYVNLSMFPNTGLPLPLFSLGGSSLVINMIMLGVLFNLSKRPGPGFFDR